MTAKADTPLRVDAVILGGGVAGLWLLNLLRHRGYGAVLLESRRLGGGQTALSQGIIHGGLKYALGGVLNSASEALADMPARWRACLAGTGEVDLRPLRPLAEHLYLFGPAQGLGRLAKLLASRALRGRVAPVSGAGLPPFLQGSRASIKAWRCEDFVLDPRQLARRLAELGAPALYRSASPPDVRPTADGLRVFAAPVTLDCERLILAAGAGNEALLQQLGWDLPMQRRPVHQVYATPPSWRPEASASPASCPPAFGHCIGIRSVAEPRLTLSSQPIRAVGLGETPADSDWIWSLGGHLATDGVKRDARAQIAACRTELAACLPGLDWTHARFKTQMIDRAEPRQTNRQKPDTAFAKARGACIVCWPGKLSLTPDLGDRVLALMPPPRFPSVPALPLANPDMAETAWTCE